MLKKILFLVVHFIGFTHLAFSQKVKLEFDVNSLQQVYAVGTIEKSLLKQGYSLQGESAEYTVSLSVNAAKLGSEAFSISVENKKITIVGGDERGLIYGGFSFAEDINNGVRLEKIKARNESPNLPFRAIKFNLPWDSYREGYAMELHEETCRDLNFWKEFLDMMAENRFNALTLWNLHPFTYMIRQ
jgi:hypothetical protein